MKTMVITFWIVIHLAGWVAGAGLLQAFFNKSFPRLYNQCECKNDRAFAIMFAFPFWPVIVAGSALTGFQYGWSLSCKDAPELDSFGEKY